MSQANLKLDDQLCLRELPIAPIFSLIFSKQKFPLHLFLV